MKSLSFSQMLGGFRGERDVIRAAKYVYAFQPNPASVAGAINTTSMPYRFARSRPLWEIA